MPAPKPSPSPPRTPSEIARETLKLLATRKLVPSPENYQALYHEIAGTQVAAQPFPEGPLRQIAQRLPAQTPEQKRLFAQFETGITHKNWAALQSAVLGYAMQPYAVATPVNDPVLLSHPGDGLTAQDAIDQLKEPIARLVENVLPALGEDDTRLLTQAQELIAFARIPTPDFGTFRTLLSNYGFRLSFVAEEQQAIKASLLNLLHLTFQNISELSLDQSWLHGQMDALMAAATPPLTLRRLDDVQLQLKDVILKQTEAKHHLVQAQTQARELLTVFIDRLGQMAESSSEHHVRIESCVKEVEAARSVEEVSAVLQEAVQATRVIVRDTRQMRDELAALRTQSEHAQAEVERLQTELERVSAQARHDPLTGALNRRGLDEAMEREISNAQRRDMPLSLSLLDLDDFRKINEQHGHEGGDQTLTHLAAVARESLRPSDMLARYGGEEFVIILPDTQLPEAVEVMTRLQRTLTSRIFLHENKKVLVTFSAGVAQLSTEESGADALRRADQAMYLAKRSGKNRVVSG